jgi:hypothetical protein
VLFTLGALRFSPFPKAEFGAPIFKSHDCVRGILQTLPTDDNMIESVSGFAGGRLITDRQVRWLFSLIKVEENLECAASKAGMDAKTARKYRRLGRLRSELESGERWRTRPDPFAEVWEAVRGLLENSPGLEAKTVFEHLQRVYPGRFQEGQLRTLQRKVKQWRATEGPSREVFCVQQHHPGRLAASVFCPLSN